MTTMTVDRVRAMLVAELKGSTYRRLAEKVGVTPSYLNDIVRGNREPGQTVLEYLGLERMPATYRKVR